MLIYCSMIKIQLKHGNIQVKPDSSHLIEVDTIYRLNKKQKVPCKTILKALMDKYFKRKEKWKWKWKINHWQLSFKLIGFRLSSFIIAMSVYQARNNWSILYTNKDIKHLSFHSQVVVYVRTFVIDKKVKIRPIRFQITQKYAALICLVIHSSFKHKYEIDELNQLHYEHSFQYNTHCCWL